MDLRTARAGDHVSDGEAVDPAAGQHFDPSRRPADQLGEERRPLVGCLLLAAGQHPPEAQLDQLTPRPPTADAPGVPSGRTAPAGTASTAWELSRARRGWSTTEVRSPAGGGLRAGCRCGSPRPEQQSTPRRRTKRNGSLARREEGGLPP